ncbi:Unknown protein [Striga hermonthica]|uniref:Uncharacterized protein n=1 Tax=Striga hermonthica TaxID=68872 RepID=A0A9N7NRD9_STRHE|nr:Unknown protein [Striga hermonthica]
MKPTIRLLAWTGAHQRPYLQETSDVLKIFLESVICDVITDGEFIKSPEIDGRPPVSGRMRRPAPPPASQRSTSLTHLMSSEHDSKDVGLKGLTSKRHMKIVMRWMRERQKLPQICNHVGPNKQFLYATWFTKPDVKQTRPGTGHGPSS